MTREQFLDWAELQEERYEFDGFVPVAMTGGTRQHGLICHNLYAALRQRLRGSGCQPLGPDAGIPTIGEAVRYPDALVTCTKGLGSDRLIEDVIVAFEVLSPTSGRTDRIVKVREYRAVTSLRRYLILEYSSAAVTIHARTSPDDAWTTTIALAEDSIELPEIGLTIPVAELYEGIVFGGPDSGPTPVTPATA